MSLPGRQQHALNQIEHQFAVAEPKLMAMFAAFTRVAGAEAMPPRGDHPAAAARAAGRAMALTVAARCCSAR